MNGRPSRPGHINHYRGSQGREFLYHTVFRRHNLDTSVEFYDNQPGTMLSLSVPEIQHTTRRLITEDWARALRAIFPAQCAACGRRLTDDPVPFFCRTCWGQIRPLSGPACPRCDRPFPSPIAFTYSPTHLCGDCRKRMPSFTKAWSLYPYEHSLTRGHRAAQVPGKIWNGAFVMSPPHGCIAGLIERRCGHACPASSRSPSGTGV